MRVGIAKFRRNMAAHLDRVERDRTELVLTRPNRENLVILPRAELEGLRESLHLLGSPANAWRLHRSMAEIAAGRCGAHDLIDA